MNKFRSWNETKKAFLYFCNGYYFDTLEDLNKYEEDLKNGIKGCYCTNNTDFDWQNAEQSTGIFNNNDIEIFEGDVINFEDSALGESGVDESAFDFINKATVIKKDFYFTLENFLSEKEDTDVYNRLDEIEYLEELKDLFEYSIVIGNIHENKENKNVK